MGKSALSSLTISSPRGHRIVNLPTDTGKLGTQISVYFVGIKTLMFIISFTLFLGLYGLAQKIS